MRSVIVTRPIVQADNLIHILRREGYRVIRAPVLEIVPANLPMPDISCAVVVATSANAFTGQPLPMSLLRLPCYCVGGSTAQAAKTAGFTQVIEGASDGAALSTLLRDHYSHAGVNILHLCGRDVAARAKEALMSTGLTIVPWVRYEAQLTETLTPEVQAAIGAGEVDAVMLYSSRTAQHYMDLLQKAGLRILMKRVHVVTISQTVANLLNPVDWRSVAVAAQPSDAAMVQALKDGCTACEGDHA